jgi:tRNA dimethylallyltransferase
VDFEEGILQTIGFKEFIPYLSAFEATHDELINRFVEAPETTPEPEGWKLLVKCLEELKLVTQRYSKKQMKWIRNRFLGSDMREVPSVYPLDTSDVSKWNERVSHPAIETVESFIANQAIKLKPLEKVKRLAEGMDEEKTFRCQGS